MGSEIHRLASELWPINRSITGDGNRETLAIIKKHLPALKIFEVPTGTKVFDWTIPNEWRARNAWIKTPTGERICDFSKNNLHLVGYSTPIAETMSLEKLSKHLHSLPDQPTAIPYITSYYKERWGFCISEDQRQTLPEGDYEVFIDSELFEGSLTYGELLVKGSTDREVFLSTYICHPSMANNELSGPTVTTFLAKWIEGLTHRRYSYRIIFIPETIGSLTYLSRHLVDMQNKVFAGFVVNCVGDDRAYSFVPSRNGSTISDIVGKHVLKWIDSTFKAYKWTDRGGDERQYCAPHVDLPIAVLMRSAPAKYEEYHTSLDDLVNVVTPSGLEGGYHLFQRTLEAIEKNLYPSVKVFGEPQLGKRGLYPDLGTKNFGDDVHLLLDFISWSDGQHSIIDIAEICEVPVWDLYPLVERLVEHNLVELLDSQANK